MDEEIKDNTTNTPAAPVAVIEAPPPDAIRHGRRLTNRGDRIFFRVLKGAAFIPIVLMILFVGVLLYGAWPSIERFGVAFLFTDEWDPGEDREAYGALASIYGTLFSSLMALAIAGPIGIGVAAFLNEVFPPKLRSTVIFLIEILATIPSIVYGIWAFFVLVPLISEYIQPFFTEYEWPLSPVPTFPTMVQTALANPWLLTIVLGVTAFVTITTVRGLLRAVGRRISVTHISYEISSGKANAALAVFCILAGAGAAFLAPINWPGVGGWVSQKVGPEFFLFRGPPIGVGLLAGTTVLAIMILPLIVSISLEAIRAVPSSYREAALGLGATRWEVIRMAVLPAARSGLMGGCILALGRALGETMAVTMVIGNANLIRWSLFEPAASIASMIANNFSEAFDLMRASLIELALILFAMTFVVNLAARYLILKLGGSRKGTMV